MNNFILGRLRDLYRNKIMGFVFLFEMSLLLSQVQISFHLNHPKYLSIEVKTKCHLFQENL